MDICEVYAQNIQIPQLKEVLSTDRHTTEGFEEERKSFLYWLKEEYKLGFRYDSQLEAWYWYKVDIDYGDSEDDFSNGSVWMMELEKIFEGKISVGNYNEFGGQL